MKTSSILSLLTGILFVVTSKAQEEPTVAIQLHPAITVTGEAGSTYVIESKTDLEGDFWLTRGVVELTSTQAQWFDSVPADTPKRIYRAVKVTKPEGVQPVENMVWIPPGTFTMGSPESERGRWEEDGPLTRVTLTQSFWMSKYEVTQREYLALMGNNPSRFQPPDYPEDLDRPVEQVWWDDAVAYCQALTEQERAAGHLPEGWEYRLPTEAEWEYACRAVTTTRYSFGDALECHDGCGPCGLLDQYMWWCGNAEGSTHRVGHKLPTSWGLHDMHGNVWEWCQDWWSFNLPGGSLTDPKGPESGSGRVFRGGSWDRLARRCRSAIRGGLIPDGLSADIGFRVVLAPGQPWSEAGEPQQRTADGAKTSKNAPHCFSFHLPRPQNAPRAILAAKRGSLTARADTR